MIWRKRIPSQKNTLVSWHENKAGIFEGRKETLMTAALVIGVKKRCTERYSGPVMQRLIVRERIWTLFWLQ